MGTMESAQTLAPPLCAYIAKPIAATARPTMHQYSAWMAHGHWQCKSAKVIWDTARISALPPPGGNLPVLESSQNLWRQTHTLCEQAKRMGLLWWAPPLPWGWVDCGVLVVDLGSVAHTPSREYHSPVPHTSYFGLFLCIQPQSSPQVCPLKPEFQHPATPHSTPLTPTLHPHTLTDTFLRLSNAAR